MWTLATQGQIQGIWFWAAIYTFAVCAYSAAYQVRIRNWPSTTGSLQHATVARFGINERNLSSQNYEADTRYSYEVSNIQYEGSRLSPWVLMASHNLRVLLRWQLSSIRSGPAGEVDVFYNPKNPAKSFLIVPSKLGILITFLVSVLPGALYFYQYPV